ncbi:adenine phosphoribosyltransferase [Candidatus Bathyarchaeota archaeon]|nr:adenine phosphoribosyltransferase [Candidatus Bathyarchaeota archaeon]RJS74101.1 MAG: adenine phosphoribosyltransferase [Candidatus Bathyarchaeota archaeon]
MNISHIQDLKFRMMTVDLLRIAKRRFTYRELSQMVGLQITVLSRYVKGHVLPSTDRAKAIWKTLNPIVGLEKELWETIKFNSDGYFDNTNIIGNSSILHLASQDALARFAGRRITKVLTAAVDGIPLATMVAQAINVNLVIAKRSKEVGVKEFVEETYVPKGTGMMVTLYIPKDSIKKNDSVLIVDDVIRTGETQRALINLVHKCKAEVTGIYALVAIGDEFERRLSIPPGCKFETVVRIVPERIKPVEVRRTQSFLRSRVL